MELAVTLSSLIFVLQFLVAFIFYNNYVKLFINTQRPFPYHTLKVISFICCNLKTFRLLSPEIAPLRYRLGSFGNRTRTVNSLRNIQIIACPLPASNKFFFYCKFFIGGIVVCLVFL